MHSVSIRRTACHVASAAALCGALRAQDGPAPLELFATDPVLDHVYKFEEMTGDGTFNQGGETIVLYDDTHPGASIPLDDPDCITAAPDDTLYVGDSTRNLVIALNDIDENGECYGVGEHRVFFDGNPAGNFHGIHMAKVNGVAVQVLGEVWVASQNTQAGETDLLLRLEDNFGDGDANDFQEARVYYAMSEAALADHVPTGVELGIDGLVYYLENGTTGAFSKGVYRLEDLDSSGAIDQPGEATVFFVPPALAQPADLTALDQDEDVGAWYVLDRANRVVWRALDADASGAIDQANEYGQFWQLPTGGDCFDLAVLEPDDVYAGESLAPDRLRRALDGDASATIDSSEEQEIYDDSIQAVNVDDPHGLATDFHAHHDIGDPFCGGAALAPCPCGNQSGLSTAGCLNSLAVPGVLEAEGSTGVGNDDAEFLAHNLPPNVSAVLFQGLQAVNGGVGLPFYDGLRCVAGQIRRLGIEQADGNGDAVWGPGLAAQGGWVASQTVYFQVWYRDPSGPCGTTANLTNALVITWDP